MQTVQRQDGPIRIVTLYKFEPDEVRTIQAAAPKAKVEIVIAQSREEFRKLLPLPRWCTGTSVPRISIMHRR